VEAERQHAFEQGMRREAMLQPRQRRWKATVSPQKPRSRT
jgi:hypothetical protein